MKPGTFRGIRLSGDKGLFSETVLRNPGHVIAMKMVLSMKKPINKDIKSEQIEELHYGPGIVSKLRCRYMNLTLNQGCTKQRPSLNILRRSTSLNNLIEVPEQNVIRQDILEKKDSEIDKQDNYRAQSFETLLKSKAEEKDKCDLKSINQNEQPPPDMVKEKLRIFEPNWINTKKAHCSINKSLNAISSKIVPSLMERKQEFDDSNKSRSVLRTVVKNPTKNIKTGNKPVDDNIMVNNDMTDKQDLKSSKSIAVLNDGLILKKSQNTNLNDGQSITYNFSNRKEFPSHLPSIAIENDKQLTIIDSEEKCTKKFEFINANIVIEGKSCIKSVGKNVKLKLKFNDLLTSTFEYPSENCLFDAHVSTASNMDHLDMRDYSDANRSKIVLVVSKNGTEATNNFSGYKSDVKSYWSDETKSTDILF